MYLGLEQRVGVLSGFKFPFIIGKGAWKTLETVYTQAQIQTYTQNRSKIEVALL